MLVSDYITQFMVEKGIKDVFFIDGSAAASLIVSVANNKNLNYYCPWHEQAGAFAADGYVKTANKLTAMIATSGPAGQNLLNGIAASYYDSYPALYFTGQINSRFMKPSDTIRQHGFQENDIVSMAKPVCKYAVLIRNAGDVRYELEKAYYLAVSGRPGPVLLDVPMDIQKTHIDPEKLKGFEEPKIETIFEIGKVKKQIFELIKLIKAAKRPAILIGGGIRIADAVKETKQLLKTLNIPFFVTWNMLDFCEKDDRLYGGRVGTFGGDGRNFGIQNSDLLLTIGSRISGRITGGMMNTFARAAKKVIVDIDKEEIKYQQVKGDLNICCDAKVFSKELLREAKEHLKNTDFSAWRKMVINWKKKYPVFKQEYWEQKGSVNPYVFVKVLSDQLVENDVIVIEAGGNCVITSQAFEAKKGQRIFSNNGNSSLGYALPAAIGACIANDKKQVICICGDGGLNFNIQELQTVKYHKLPIKIMLFNNYAYGITKAYRDTNFNANYAGVDKEHGVESPDFKKVAAAYGIKALEIKDHSELKKRIKEVLNSDEPVLCDINMIGFYDYNPKLGWGVPIEDQFPFLPREEFRKNLLIDPIPGWEDPVYPGKVK
jgi:acetolactate synthase-1/2/3 large subunit